MPGPSILLVEDDDDVAEALAEVLRESGYEVVVEGYATAALERLRAGYRPAAMLVDLTLPGLPGAAFLDQCRRDPALGQIPAIATSAHHPADTPSHHHSYLQKPFTPEELLQALRRLVPHRPP